MPTIHINTDLLRTLGTHFVTFNDSLQTQIQPQIRGVASQLENDWQGTSRSTYETLYQEWQTKVNAIILSGEDIGRHLQTTATSFETADHSI